MRELGLVTISGTWNFTQMVRNRFDEDGNLLDESFLDIDKFLDELLWMAETLRYGGERTSRMAVVRVEAVRSMTCPKCDEG